MRKIILHKEAFDEMLAWSRTDRKKLSKIFELIDSIVRTPFHGIGKPEPLRHDLAGCWSRRITQEDRLIYRVTDEEIFIMSCKEHYDDR